MGFIKNIFTKPTSGTTDSGTTEKNQAETPRKRDAVLNVLKQRLQPKPPVTTRVYEYETITEPSPHSQSNHTASSSSAPAASEQNSDFVPEVNPQTIPRQSSSSAPVRPPVNIVDEEDDSDYESEVKVKKNSDAEILLGDRDELIHTAKKTESAATSVESEKDRLFKIALHETAKRKPTISSPSIKAPMNGPIPPSIPISEPLMRFPEPVQPIDEKVLKVCSLPYSYRSADKLEDERPVQEKQPLKYFSQETADALNQISMHGFDPYDLSTHSLHIRLNEICKETINKGRGLPINVRIEMAEYAIQEISSASNDPIRQEILEMGARFHFAQLFFEELKADFAKSEELIFKLASKDGYYRLEKFKGRFAETIRKAFSADISKTVEEGGKLSAAEFEALMKKMRGKLGLKESSYTRTIVDDALRGAYIKQSDGKLDQDKLEMIEKLISLESLAIAKIFIGLKFNPQEMVQVGENWAKQESDRLYNEYKDLPFSNQFFSIKNAVRKSVAERVGNPELQSLLNVNLRFHLFLHMLKGEITKATEGKQSADFKDIEKFLFQFVTQSGTHNSQQFRYIYLDEINSALAPSIDVYARQAPNIAFGNILNRYKQRFVNYSASEAKFDEYFAACEQLISRAKNELKLSDPSLSSNTFETTLRERLIDRMQEAIAHEDRSLIAAFEKRKDKLDSTWKETHQKYLEERSLTPVAVLEFQTPVYFEEGAPQGYKKVWKDSKLVEATKQFLAKNTFEVPIQEPINPALDVLIARLREANTAPIVSQDLTAQLERLHWMKKQLNRLPTHLYPSLQEDVDAVEAEVSSQSSTPVTEKKAESAAPVKEKKEKVGGLPNSYFHLHFPELAKKKSTQVWIELKMNPLLARDILRNIVHNKEGNGPIEKKVINHFGKDYIVMREELEGLEKSTQPTFGDDWMRGEKLLKKFYTMKWKEDQLPKDIKKFVNGLIPKHQKRFYTYVAEQAISHGIDVPQDTKIQWAKDHYEEHCLISLQAMQRLLHTKKS